MKIIKIIIFEALCPKKRTNLTILSVEKKIADQLKYNEIIDTFANLRRRKVN